MKARLSIDRGRLAFAFAVASVLLAGSGFAVALRAEELYHAVVLTCSRALVLIGSSLTPRAALVTGAFGLLALGAAAAAAGFMRDAVRVRALESAARAASVTARVAGREVRLTRGLPHAAWTVGTFRPRVYVSREVNARLSPRERKALIAHEEAHVRNRDLLKRAVMDAVRRAFFFIPSLGEVVASFRLGQEIRADRAALRATGKRALGGLYLAASAPREAAGWSAAFPFESPRLAEVLDGGPPSVRLSVPRLLVSAFMAGLLLSAAFVGQARASHGEDGGGVSCDAIETFAPRSFTPLIGGRIELYTPLPENACRAEAAC